MKKIVLLVLLMTFSQVFSQKNISQYKYVVIPAKFDFVKKVDRYQTSSLTKFLFNKYGFTAFLDNEKLPLDLEQNSCKALKVDVIDNSKFLITRSVIQLKDCRGNVLFSSVEGKSKEKEYKAAYHQAIRQAFNSVKTLNYAYTPSISEKSIALGNNQGSQPLMKNKKVVGKPEKQEVPVIKNKITKRGGNNFVKKTNPVLFSKSVKKGFLLLGKNQQTVFHLLFTDLEELFILKNKNGIAYKGKNNWIAEYYNSNGDKVVENFDVRELQAKN